MTQICLTKLWLAETLQWREKLQPESPYLRSHRPLSNILGDWIFGWLLLILNFQFTVYVCFSCHSRATQKLLSSSDLEFWPITLFYEVHLYNFKVNEQAKYLGQRSSIVQKLLSGHTRPRTDKHQIVFSTWTTKWLVNMHRTLPSRWAAQ